MALKKSRLVILVVLLAALALGGRAAWNFLHPAPSPVARPLPQGPELTIDAAALQAAYDANEDAADQKYLAKPLLVTGVVAEIAMEEDADPEVLLDAGPEKAVHLNGLTREVASALKRGQAIRVACSGGGANVGSPVLNDCTLQ